MAELWLARQSGHGGIERMVVLKRALPHHASDPEFQQMFLREGRIAASLDHPNIAGVYESGVTPDGRSFLAMEYVHGVDLHELLRSYAESVMPLPHALTIATALCAALEYVHARRDLDGRHLGLVHRDVSPSNVLLSFDGAIKLTDFGVARADAASLATQSGAVKGKLAYMAPEQARGLSLDPRADLYSVGVILYEMTVGQRPFGRTQDVALLYRLLEEAPPPPVAIVTGYPAELSSIISRLLSRDRGNRFSSAAEVRNALETFAANHRLMLSGPRLGEHVTERCGARPMPSVTAAMHASSPTEGLDKIQSVITRVPVQTRPPRRTLPWLFLGAAAAGITLGVLALLLPRLASRPSTNAGGIDETGEQTSQEARQAPPVVGTPPLSQDSSEQDAPADPLPQTTPVALDVPPATPPNEGTTQAETERMDDEPAAPEPPRASKKKRRNKKKRPPTRSLDSPLPFG